MTSVCDRVSFSNIFSYFAEALADRREIYVPAKPQPGDGKFTSFSGHHRFGNKRFDYGT
jgi:hypothetical protein